MPRGRKKGPPKPEQIVVVKDDGSEVLEDLVPKPNDGSVVGKIAISCMIDRIRYGKAERKMRSHPSPWQALKEYMEWFDLSSGLYRAMSAEQWEVVAHLIANRPNDHLRNVVFEDDGVLARYDIGWNPANQEVFRIDGVDELPLDTLIASIRKCAEINWDRTSHEITEAGDGPT